MIFADIGIDVDLEPTPAQRAAAEALIEEERANVPDDPHHALLRPLYTPSLTSAMQAEVQRYADAMSGGTKPQPLKSIDLSRYEVDEDDSDDAAALSRAYTSQTYLRGRRAHLALLGQFGKNAWLVSNWQTEADLKALEDDLTETRKAVDLVTVQRQRAQNDAAGELRSLEETWRTGLGRVLETEAAAEELRLQILESRRRRADNGENP